MPNLPSEPEKYSIDEMLERLKEKSSENPLTDGEWVTRADGTRAVRVRKHKRRTEQPKRENAKRFRRIRIIQVTAAIVCLLLIGLCTVGSFVYSNTAAYRKFITNTISQYLGATVAIKDFRVNPASANAESIELAWPDGNVLKSIQLNGLSAKISPFSLFGAALNGEEVFAREGTLCLQAPASNSPLLATPDQPGNIPVQFNRVTVPKFHIIFGNPTQPALKIIASQASLHLNKTRNETSLRLYRGNLQFTDWPLFEIDRAVMEFNGANTELIGLRILDAQPKRGILELAGPIQPFVTETPATLNVKLQNFNFGTLLGPDFGELINAIIDTRQATSPNSLTFIPGSKTSVELDIAFKSSLSSTVSIKGLPFLFSLMRTLNDKWYENPFFAEETTGRIHRDSAKIELRELKLENKSRMTIKGNIAIAADKSLSGTLEIGIPASVAELSQNSKIDAILSPLREGFRWFTVKIGGTSVHPSDNFAEIYAAAKATADPEPNTPEDANESNTAPANTFDNLTRPKNP
jgi:hypothetical protein